MVGRQQTIFGWENSEHPFKNHWFPINCYFTHSFTIDNTVITWFSPLTPLPSLSLLPLWADLKVTWITSRGTLLACFLSLWMGLMNDFGNYSETFRDYHGLFKFSCLHLPFGMEFVWLKSCGFLRGRMVLDLERALWLQW